MSNYDLKAVIRDYAEAKVDFDNRRLEEDNEWQARFNRLVAMEQLLIHISKQVHP